MRCLVALSLAHLLAGQAPAGQVATSRFFAAGQVAEFTIQLTDEALAKLRGEPRQWVRSEVRVDRTTLDSVALKLKGAAGSFREVDDRPALTLRFDKFSRGQRWHGMTKVHLNNSVQDDTALCEWLGARVYSAAGYPAPRVGHALVSLNGKPLGLYVLREAFDAEFLASRFGTEAGNLYEGGFCQDLDAELEKDAGDGPADRSDLARVIAACRAPVAKRPATLAAVVDVPRFVDFVAIEAMLGHWDGYSKNRNNYRLWLPRQGRALFLPHGMDQLYGDATASILTWPPALVASAALEHPPTRKLYRERLRQLLPLFAPQVLLGDLDAVAERVAKRLPDDAARTHREAVAGLRERIKERYQSLREQVAAPEPQPLQLARDKAVPVRGWTEAAESEGIEVAAQRLDGIHVLAIRCTQDGEQAGAWRTTVLLARGRYRLSAQARCTGVIAPAADENGEVGGGVSLAVDDARSARLYDKHAWQALTCDFEVAEFQREVEFTARLRARGGRAWYKAEGFTLKRLE